MKAISDAKIVAMINDLSVEAMCSVVCLSPHIQTKLRQLLHDEFIEGGLLGTDIIEAWGADDE